MVSTLKDATAAFLEMRERVYAYLLAVVRDRTVAEDLFQELFVAIADAMEKGEEIVELEAWCRGVARNLALRHWRDQRTSKTVPSSGLLELIDRAFDENGDQLAHLDRMKGALVHCREALAPAAQNLLDLRYTRDLPIAEISQATKRTPRGVITALARIREQLLACMAKRMPEGA